MITYGLKLWSHNEELFAPAVEEYKKGSFGFIEIYTHTAIPFNFNALASLKGIPVTVHATHTEGFHEFNVGDEQKEVWKRIAEFADFFDSPTIVVHTGQDHTLESFRENLAAIDDPRIFIENMAGLDVSGSPMFGQAITDLVEIKKLKPICFDFEKAVKAACYQELDYKEYIIEALGKLSPTYFHISGGDSKNPMDQHLNLMDSDIDFAWIKRMLETLPEVRLVFETPKMNGLENDLANMQYFRDL